MCLAAQVAAAFTLVDPRAILRRGVSRGFAERFSLAAVAAVAFVGAALVGLGGTAAPAAVQAASTIRFVDDDTGCGGASPCHATIQAAVDAAKSGDTVRVLPGTYHESVVVTDKALVFEGPGIAGDGSPPHPSQQALWTPSAGRPLTVDALTADITKTWITGFHMLSSTDPIAVAGRPGPGPALLPGLPPGLLATRVLDVRIADNAMGGSEALVVAHAPGARILRNRSAGTLRVAEATGANLEGNRVIGARGVGLAIVQSDGAVIRANRVEKSGGAAIVVDGGVGNTRADIIDGIVVDAGRAGIATRGRMRLFITATQVTGVRGAGLAITDALTVRVVDTTVVDNIDGIRLVETVSPGGASIVIGGSPDHGNRIAGNTSSALTLVNSSGSAVSSSGVDARFNDWGTAYLGPVEDSIRHRPDATTLGLVSYIPVLGATDQIAVAVDPARMVAGGSAGAVLVTLADIRGNPPAADTVVALSAHGGAVAPVGNLAEAESSGVGRTGAWEVLRDTSYGPASDGGYVRSAAAGSALAWTYQGAGVIRYGQAAAAPATFDVTVNTGPPVRVVARGPERMWVERPLPSAPGTSNRVTVTVVSGAVAVDRLASGAWPGETGRMEGVLTPGPVVGAGVVTATALGAGGDRNGLFPIELVPGPASMVEIEPLQPEVRVGGETTTVTVSAFDLLGRPVADGTAAHLIASSGTLSQADLELVDGSAQTVYQSGDEVGAVVLTATVESVVATHVLEVVAGEAAALVLSAERAALSANSRDSTLLRAEVHDRFMNPARDGTVVAFTTTLGSLSQLSPTSLGVATALLTAGVAAGDADVVAVVNGVGHTVRLPFRAPDLVIEKSVEPPSVVIPRERVTYTLEFTNRGPGSVYDAEISDTLPDSLVSPVITTSGPTLERLPGPRLAWRAPVLRAGEVGVVTVSARVDPARPWSQREVVTNEAAIAAPSAAEARPSDNASTAEVVVVPGAAFTVTVSAPARLSVGGASGVVVARITDRFGNPAADGTGVFFSTDRGSVLPEVAQTRDGEAQTTLSSGSSSGVATVRALTLENRGGSARVLFTPGPAATLGLASEHPSVSVGGATTVISATLTDAHANPLVGENIRFSTTLGRVAPAEVGVPSGGTVTTTLLSGVRTGIAEVLAVGGGISATLSVPFTAGQLAGIELALHRHSFVVGESVAATAIARDELGNSVPGVVVAFDTTLGRVIIPQAVTGVDGTASTMVRVLQPGAGVLRATAGPFEAEQEFTVVPARNYLPMALGGTRQNRRVVLAVNDSAHPGALGMPPLDPHAELLLVLPRFLTAGGSPAGIAAQVVTDGEPAPDGLPVTFSGSLGVTLQPVRATTENGLARVSAVPGQESGFARIDAVAQGISGSAIVWVRPGPAARISDMRAVPAVGIRGKPLRVIATVRDEFGNLGEGDQVHWSADGGTVEAATSWVEFGRTETHVVPSTGGTLRLAARSNEASARLSVPVVDATPRRHTIWLPLTISAERETCVNALANSWFETDGDSNGLPDGWSVEDPAGVSLVAADGLGGGRALRLTMVDLDHAPRVSQDFDATGGTIAALRLWLRGSGALRASVWSMVTVGERRVRAPVVIETLRAADEWSLHVLPLPQPPAGATTVELSARQVGDGDVAVDVARVALDICP
jgi:uncharacterized repeat protein (TIGR01451 family)